MKEIKITLTLFLITFFCESIFGQYISKQEDYFIMQKRIRFKSLHPYQSYQYFDFEKSEADLDIFYMNYSEGYKEILRITKKNDNFFLTKVNFKDSVCINISDKAIIDSIYKYLPNPLSDTVSRNDYYVLSYKNIKNNNGFFYAYKINRRYYSSISFNSCNYSILNDKDYKMLKNEIEVFKYLLKKFKDFNVER